MIRKIMAIVCIFCLLFVITGCGSTIENDEEAAKEISDANEEITGITEDLNEINEGLEESSS